MALTKERIDRSKPVRLQAAYMIEEAILHGHIRPGEEVPQLKLSKRLGLSQPTIREALQELEHRGLVVKHGRVKRVTNFSEQDLGNIFQVRMLLEPFACRLAAYNWTEQLSDELEKCLALMRKFAEQRKYYEHVRVDVDFHRAIWKHQPNRQLEQQLNALCMPLFAYDLVRRDSERVYDWNIRQTQRILMVLRTRDGERAEKVVRHIIEKFLRKKLLAYRRPSNPNSNLPSDAATEIR
jgi:DNA-binding GntR family transcriptional regulator